MCVCVCGGGGGTALAHTSLSTHATGPPHPPTTKCLVQVQINDRYEFYDELDLDHEGRRYLSKDADCGVRNKYKLLAVLVHSGGVHGGHYYAFIRPDGRQWLRFDDERVEKVDAVRAIEDNYGADTELRAGGVGLAAYRLPAKFANAYMLVYVRESEWDSVMCEVTEQDISDHVCARLKASGRPHTVRTLMLVPSE